MKTNDHIKFNQKYRSYKTNFVSIKNTVAES